MPARLPPFDTRVYIAHSDSLDASGHIGYRQLHRDDFLAAQPPDYALRHAERLGALTCGVIVPDNDFVVQYETNQRTGNTWLRIKNSSYRGKMDRNCSWWNPAQNLIPDAYILEHEQIHFALLESYASKINREIDELRIQVNSVDEVTKAAKDHATRLLQRGLDELAEESLRFDAETSETVNPVAQRRWLREVENRLATAQDVDSEREEERQPLEYESQLNQRVVD
jgi:hypothetical protein